MWFWPMNFKMNPASGLLYAQLSPLIFSQKFAFGVHFLEDFFGENDMSVFVVVVAVFVGVLDFGGIVRHKYYNEFKQA